MKFIGILVGAIVLAFVLTTANTTIFANSCCGVKKDAHECDKECESGCIKKTSASEGSDSKCPVCGQAAGSKGQQEDVEHGGKTAHLCCEGCANEYKANPDKYAKSEHPRQSHREEHPRSEHPKKKKERGTGYY